MIWTSKLESSQPRVSTVILEYEWSERRKIKISYERDNKENQTMQLNKQNEEN